MTKESTAEAFTQNTYLIFTKTTYQFSAFETQVDQYIHRMLVEEDAHHVEESNGELFHASSEAGKKLYRMGDFAESRISNLDSFLLSKVQYTCVS